MDLSLRSGPQRHWLEDQPPTVVPNSWTPFDAIVPPFRFPHFISLAQLVSRSESEFDGACN
jgi:hypothetical protein